MFHYKDGWFFSRLTNGSIRLRKHSKADDPGSSIDHELIIDRPFWDSLYERLEDAEEVNPGFGSLQHQEPIKSDAAGPSDIPSNVGSDVGKDDKNKPVEDLDPGNPQRQSANGVVGDDVFYGNQKRKDEYDALEKSIKQLGTEDPNKDSMTKVPDADQDPNKEQKPE